MKPDPSPNIVFVLADDLGYGDLGCFGQSRIHTPHLDRMAAEGMRWTHFYAGAPVCAPSRSVLMTGLHTGHTRVRGNAGSNNPQAQMLRRSDPTVAEALHRHGYTTGLFGKWGLANEGEEGVPTRKGFDRFVGYLSQVHAHNPYPPFLMDGERRRPLRNTRADRSPVAGWKAGYGFASEKRDYAPDRIAEDALDWVDRNARRPFFLYWSLVTPHANNEATRATGNGQEVPDLGEYRDAPWPLPDRAYAATVTRLDRDLGRLMELLRRRGIDDNTLVVFSSDNGPHREGGNDPKRFASSGPLRGLKRDLTEGGIRVPTIARWPKSIAAGVTTSVVGDFADLFPTFCDVAGAPVPEGIDGVSLVPTLRGDASRQSRRPVRYWEFHEGGFSQAVLMDDRWKAIRRRRRDAAVEIYDLATDLAEAHDLSRDRYDLVLRALRAFGSERSDNEDWPIRDAAQ